MNQIIEHSGIIKNIDDNCIQVLIIQESACCECHAQGVCTSADKDNKIIEVESSDHNFRVGDNVILSGKQSIGAGAVSLAFIIPFILILTTLITMHSIGLNEIFSGAMSIGILLPYYIILSLFNKKLKTKFKFEIKKEYGK